MYLEHFGLREHPFSLTPDTDFWFEEASHRDALNMLRATLRSGEGFLKVTAEVGLGKTLLCRQLLRELDDWFLTAYLPDPQLSPSALRIALAEELRIRVLKHWTDGDVLKRIRSRLIKLCAQGRRVVLLIDEAHRVPDETLEAVRLLTNLETEKFKLLQVVIVGQPELDRRLARPCMRQLKQRVSFACTLSPLGDAATAGYVAHRLRVAGCHADPLFEGRAVRALCSASRGTPRLINVLCHKALMVAYGRGEERVERMHVDRAVADTDSAVQSWSWRSPAPLLRALGFGSAGGFAGLNGVGR